MIEVNGLVKRFDGFAALDGAALSVPAGSVYGLVGPNGAGKSTLIRHLTGIFRQDAGTVRIGGEDVWENAALKAKLKVLAEKIEEYRSTEDAMRAALLTAQKMADSMVAEAEEKKKSLLENAESEANRKIGALRDEVAQEERRLTAAKAETADFLARVRELYEREMKLLEELPEADLAPAAPLELAKPAADVSEIEKSIMDSFKLPDLTKAAEVEPEAEEAPEEPEESPEEGNPFLDSATRAIKLSDLKFGRNYHGEE